MGGLARTLSAFPPILSFPRRGGRNPRTVRRLAYKRFEFDDERATESHAGGWHRLLRQPGRQRRRRDRAGGRPGGTRSPRPRHRQRAAEPPAAGERSAHLPRGVGADAIRCSSTPRTSWRWPRRSSRSARRSGSTSCTSTTRSRYAASAYLARQVLGEAAPRIVTTLHGTDVTHVGAHASVPGDDPVHRRGIRRADRSVDVPAHRRHAAARRRWRAADRGDPELRRHRSLSPRRRAAIPPGSTRCSPPAPTTGAPVLFHVSNFRPVKRVDDLLEVLARVRRHVPARLVLVGDGPDAGTRPSARARARTG